MNGPVAIVAGSGLLPVELSDHLARAGREHRVLALRGFAAPELRRRADAVVDLLDVKSIKTRLEQWSPSAVILAGAVQRPGPSALLGAYSLFRNRQEVREVIARGDDQVLRGAVSLLEEWGHRVVGAHELVPEILAAPGLQGAVAPSEGDRRSVAFGLDLLAALAPYDVGQAAVVEGGRVLAIEGPEGTDRMLRRVRGRGARFPFYRRQRAGVLVKAAKSGQDLRIDMPTVGPRTVLEAARCGLRGIAVGTGSTLILDRELTLRTANRKRLFIVSVDLPWTGGSRP